MKNPVNTKAYRLEAVGHSPLQSSVCGGEAREAAKGSGGRPSIAWGCPGRGPPLGPRCGSTHTHAPDERGAATEMGVACCWAGLEAPR